VKRAEALQPLSHDHYEGLQMAARIRRSLRGGEDVKALAEAIPAFWTEHLVPHFAEEEALVVPLLQKGAPALAERMRREHAALRALTEAVAAAGTEPEEALTAFADALAAHIRFEEREAFPAAERLLEATPAVPHDGDA
jgi:hemerythrin-like domain-containing protein